VLQADDRKLLKHFLPHFDGADPSLEQASALFTTFCFRKPEAQPAADGEGQESFPEASDLPVPGTTARAALHNGITTCWGNPPQWCVRRSKAAARKGTR